MTGGSVQCLLESVAGNFQHPNDLFKDIKLALSTYIFLNYKICSLLIYLKYLTSYLYLAILTI